VSEEIEFRGVINLIEWIQYHPGWTIAILFGLGYLVMLLIDIFSKPGNGTPGV